MAERDKDQQLDDLLESLLSTYSAAEPRPGMEIRIRAVLEERAGQQQRRWILGLAASAAVVLLALLITNGRTAKQDVPARIGAQKSPLEVAPGNAKRAVPGPQTANVQPVRQHRETVEKSGINSRAILQMANLDRYNFPGDELSAPQEVSPGPTRPQEAAPAITQLTSAPGLSIPDLGVQPMEIKQLTPAKDIHEKGNL